VTGLVQGFKGAWREQMRELRKLLRDLYD